MSASLESYGASPPHNLGLFRLEGFSGMRQQLLTLHTWLTGGDDLPAIAISGDSGSGKSTLATAAAWNHIAHFSDGILRVSPAGANQFRLYDVVHTVDTVFGAELTRSSKERWGLGILEQLYHRKRLLIIDKLAGATQEELTTLVDIIGHLHEVAGNSRILLIDRNFNPAIAELVKHQHLHLTGLESVEASLFIQKRAPASVLPTALEHAADLHRLSGGRPMSLRLLLGLLLDFSWKDLLGLLAESCNEQGEVHARDLAAIAVENFAVFNPQVGPLLDRLVSAAGGASFVALSDLFWANLGTEAELKQTLQALTERALIERDAFRQRVILHPIVRSYLAENAVLLGEEWERSHARYYTHLAQRYLELPIARWPEVEVEWGNIFRGADWFMKRVQTVWGGDLLTMLEEMSNAQTQLSFPKDDLELPQDLQMMQDLHLMRTYALALAHYAFWRHPPGIVDWLAAGATAALALNDLRDYALLQMNIGRQLFFTGEIERATRWLSWAQVIFDQRDLLIELANVLTDLGTSCRILNEPRKALAYFQAAFDAVAQSGDQQTLATAYLNLGSAHYSLNNQERALLEYRKALRVALRYDDMRVAASAYNNMGLVMESMDRFVDAQAAYEYALRLFRRINDEIGISASYNNLGSVCYAQGDLPQALMWYELDLGHSEKRGAWVDMAATLHNLGHVALEQNDAEHALLYFKQSRDLYAAFQLLEYMQEEEEMMHLIEQKGNK